MTQKEYVKASWKAIAIINSCKTAHHIWAADKYLQRIDILKPEGQEDSYDRLVNRLDNKAVEILF